MNNNTKAHVSLFTAQVIYAVSFVILKVLMDGFIAPFALVLLRVMVAMILYWLVDFTLIKEKTDRKDFPKLFLLALFGVIINQTFFIKGLSLTSPISAAILMITSPIIVVIIGFFILKEKITWMRGIGILIGFAGAALLMLGSGLSTETSQGDNPLGDFMIFINASAWAFYLVMVKPLMKKYHTITILRWMFTFGLIAVLPIGISDFSNVEWHTYTFKIWFYTGFVVLGTTFVAYLLNVYALKDLSPSVVSTYIYLQPLLTAVIALSTGNDTLSLSKIISAVLIFLGVYLVSKKASTTDQLTQEY